MLLKNDAWELVLLPSNKGVMRCKWVFTLKQKMDRGLSIIIKQGFTQTYGLYYKKFCPNAKLNTVKVILSCVVNQGWSLHQLDVKNAFLHNLDEVYMDIPLSLLISIGKVCKLKKAMKATSYRQSNTVHVIYRKEW